MNHSVKGNIVDISNRDIYPGELFIAGGKIKEIVRTRKPYKVYLIPGLIDAHVHIESSMLVPAEFARMAVQHGTVAVVSDPHEIANVLGIKGIHFMVSNGSKVPFKFFFGVPSCVPATDFETSGGRIDEKEIEYLFLNKKLKYLSEVMNYPGVIDNAKAILDKIKIAQKYGKVIDGHAPGLKGNNLRKYIAAGISTDHECTTRKEAEEKILNGMKILIREGSAAKNFKELIPLIEKYPEKIMFCTDDIHPDDLRDGHINKLIIAGLGMGYDFFDLLKATTLNPKIHYNLNTGLLRKHDPADFVMIDHPERMSVLKTYVNGINVYSKGKIEIRSDKSKRINVFKCKKITAEQIHIPAETDRVRVMEAFDGKLFTKERILKPGLKNRYFVSDINKDILKIVVYNRYNISKPAIAFVKGFGLKTGAIASTVAHDSHNIIAVGVSDEDIIKAINRIIELKGGIVITDGSKMDELQLNIGGIMSDQDGTMVANEYKNLNQKVQELGSELKSPFMTLSFLALLVIPELKLSDQGLFSTEKFNFTSLFYSE